MALSEAYAITYSLFLFIVVLVITLVFGKGGAIGLVEMGAWATLKTGVSIIPYLVLAWGVVRAFLSLHWEHMIPSLIGASAFGLGLACQMAAGRFLPLFVASTSAVLTYYTYDFGVKHAESNPMVNIGMATAAFLVLLAQVLTTRPASAGTYLFTPSLLNDGLATLFGIAVGLAGWVAVSAADSDLLPYSGL